MKFSTLILLGLVLVVACASADDSTTAATTASTTTSTSPEPDTCYSAANQAKEFICKGFPTWSFINVPYKKICDFVIGSITSNLKCLCGVAA